VATSVFLQSGQGKLYPRFTNLSAFAQDTWRAGPRLTLTYGLRWELNPAPSEANGNLPFAFVGFDDPATLALAPRGTRLYKTTYDNFAPRMGVAYRLSTRSGRETVLRGGAGIYYDLGTSAAGAPFRGFPFLAVNFLSNVPFPLTPTQAAPPIINLNPPYDQDGISAIDPNLKLPRTYQWSVAVEQSLGSNQTVLASYVGALGRRLLLQTVLLSPNPNFIEVEKVTNAATSDYHAMQLQFQRRLSRRLQALASYTWAHSIDDASNDNDSSGLNNRARGSSDFDVRHSLSVAVTYNLPHLSGQELANKILGDWSVDTILRAQSASPVDLIARQIFNTSSTTNIHPDLITGVALYLSDPTAPGSRLFNPAAFAVPPLGRQGTLGRNVLRGFPLYQVDLSLRRQFNLTERLNLQLRADLFNLFNHPNFGDPGAGQSSTNNISNPLFGRATSMLNQGLGSGSAGFNPLYQVGGPRSVQLSLKAQF